MQSDYQQSQPILRQIITEIFVFVAFLSSGIPAFSQNLPDDMLSMADSLRREYRFSEAAEFCQDAIDASTDSLFRMRAGDELLLSRNGENMLGFCSIPTVVARQRFSVSDFYLFYPLEDGAWRAVPNVLDSLAAGPVPSAVYAPEDEDRIYFSAADADGIRNIYRTERLDSVWSVPELLGEGLTSQSDEIFPMLSPDGRKLFFASKGLYGMGGYDLYVSSWNDETKEWGLPENMGFPYSSPADDFMFINTADGRYSIFASNRDCPADSVWVYVLEYDSMPVRRSVTDVAELKKLAELVPEDDLSRVETKGVVPDAGPQNEDVLKYVSMMKQVRALRDSVYACGKSMEDARERLSADVSGEEKDNLSAWIMDTELEQARLQRDLAAASAKLQEIEMNFLFKGVVIDVDKLQEEADREVVGADSGYAFSRRRMGGELSMKVQRPEPKFDYSFMILPEGRFAENNTLPGGLVYQIQIFSSSAMVDASRLKGLSPVFWRPGTSTRYVYSVGVFRSYSDVLSNLNKVKKAGFRSAFIVAFNDGKQVTVQKARQMEKTVRQIYRVVVSSADGNPLSDNAVTVIHALTGKEIAKVIDEGVIGYVVGPFDDRSEADIVVKGLKAAGIGTVSLEAESL